MFKRVLTFSVFFVLSACVTVNITFPPAAAQQAADQIIDQVWKESPVPAEQPKQPEASPSSDQSSLLDWLISPAQAAPNFNISTPTIQAIKDRMANRHRDLESHYDSGAIGLTNDGFINLRDANAISLSQRNKTKALLNDENSDRDQLYAEIASANGHPEWKGQIQSTFAARWISKAKKGWWYQNERGQWVQK